MTFPTEQEIEFFSSEETKRIQKLCVPKVGGFARFPDGQVGVITFVFKPQSDIDGYYRTMDVNGKWSRKVWDDMKMKPIFLPHQGQLQTMLEERGYRWDVGKLPDSYTATIWNDDIDLECEGPTPSIALGRALIEVLKEE